MGEHFCLNVNRSDLLNLFPKNLHRPEWAASIHPPQFVPLRIIGAVL